MAYLRKQAPVYVKPEESEPEQPDYINGWAVKPIKPRKDYTPPLAWRAPIEQAAKRGEIIYRAHEIYKTPRITPEYLSAMQRDQKPSIFLYRDDFDITLWSGADNFNPPITPGIAAWVAKGAVFVNAGGGTEANYAELVGLAKEFGRLVVIETTPYSTAWQAKLDCPQTATAWPEPFASYRRKRNAETVAMWKKQEAAGKPVTRRKLW